jgi:hypothetical protein
MAQNQREKALPFLHGAPFANNQGILETCGKGAAPGHG